jgi:hypothetical protein
MPGARDYKSSDIKKLFALSKNECTNPVCEQPMISDDGITVLGEICHISGANPKGPRWREELDDNERRDYKNLILLCRACHKQIDNKENEKRFTEPMLLEWKEKHLKKNNGETIEVRENHTNQAIQNLEEWFESIGVRLDRLQEGIETKIDELRLEINEQNEQIDVTQILDEFKSASYALRSCDNWFGSIIESHLERSETKKLHQWIIEPLKPKNSSVCLVTGKAGSGKTIILKDLETQLEKENIPVLGIKADRQFALNRQALEQQLGLSNSLRKSVKSILESYERIVILIDQIDALSLSQSTDSRFIDTYLQIAHEFSGFQNVRLILSIREFDLKYNPTLKFPLKHHTVKVSSLSETEVFSVITNLDIERSALSTELVQLLQTPLHLDIFSKTHAGIDNFTSIRSLNDLYYELWRQKVWHSNELNKADRIGAKQLLYRLVDNTSVGVKVSVNSTLLDDYVDQLDYLCSSGLINRTNTTIHFFHQTFHDYIFSRQFVEKGQNLTQYILNNGNALAIRSVVKMIITFLREENPIDYIQSIESILTHDKIAFHIKLLVLNLLGFDEEPVNEEYNVVGSIVLPNKELAIPFIESVNSKNWLKFLIDQKVTDAIADESLSETERWPFSALFNRMVPKAPELVLTYFLHLPDYDLKTDHVERVLHNLKDWESNEAETLFNCFSERLASQPFWFLSILEKAAPTRFNLACSSYSKYVTNQLTEISDKPKFEYHEKTLIEILAQQNEGKTFELLIEIIESDIAKTSFSNTTPYIIDRAFFMCNYEHRRKSHSHEYWFEKAFDLTKTLASKACPVFDAFLNNNLNSRYINIIRLVMLGIESNPTQYKDQGFHLLMRFLGGVEPSDGLGKTEYQLQKMIGAIYPHLSLNQKEVLNDQLLNIASDWELSVWQEDGEKKHRLKAYGHRKFEYLSAIPYDELKRFPVLKKTFQELERKFPNSQKSQEPGVWRTVGVGSPLSHEAYTKMSIDDWKRTFKKYKGGEKYYGPNSGSELEHARRFGKEVAERGEELVELIEFIIKNEKVSEQYLTEGFDGLKIGKYNPLKALDLFKRAIQRKLDDHVTMRLVWFSDYLIQSDVVDQVVVDFLSTLAIEHSDPTPERMRDNAMNLGINSVRGSAAQRLLSIQKSDFSEIILTTLERVAKDTSVGVKAALISRLAYLMSFDEERTFKIFMELVSCNDEQVLKLSFWSAHYLKNYFFEEMAGYFEQSAKYESLHEQLTAVLLESEIQAKSTDSNVLENLLSESIKARETVIEQAGRFLDHEEEHIRKICVDYYTRYFNEKHKDIASAYSHSFLHIKPEAFSIIYPFLQEYAQSETAKRDPHYYLEYLVKCSRNFPKECIDLMDYYFTYRKHNPSGGPYHTDEPLKVIIGAHRSLWDNYRRETKYIAHSIEIFDQLLKEPSLRRDAEEVLNTSEL